MRLRFSLLNGLLELDFTTSDLPDEPEDTGPFGFASCLTLDPLPLDPLEGEDAGPHVR